MTQTATATTPTNGTPPSVQGKAFDLADYRPEDGGILDAWHDAYGDKWMYVTGYEMWYRWQGTHWCKDDRKCIKH